MDAILVQPLSLGDRDGPTVVIKDSIDVAGTVTGCGSKVLADEPPAARHALVVQRLLDGGAHIVGKANMHEFAYGVTGVNAFRGTARNPKYPGRIPGGSSSGSAAAVAAGLAEIGIGTDTGGSVRVPAACCGVFGLKPSFGRLSRVGVVPDGTSLDCVGPFARDMAHILAAMTMMDPDFTALSRSETPRLGVVPVEGDAEVLATVATALERSGAAQQAAPLASFVAAYEAGLAIIAAETFAAFGHYVDDPGLGEDVRARLIGAGKITPDALTAAEAVRVRFAQEVDAALAEVDALVLPTLPILPPRLEDAADAAAVIPLTRLVRPFNLSGHPALTIPLETASGLPVGLQLIGRRGADEALCAIGQWMADQLGIEGGR
ncbi:amidase [Flavisphingomonas formosensis]|uniref:amidase n=1 Tax=Flavisphingomonas formosensis TaxID=861534 RepID=UPI0012F7E846|nr:amidase [Sphingomonas formosensis]